MHAPIRKLTSLVLYLATSMTGILAQTTDPKAVELKIKHLEDFAITGDGTHPSWESRPWFIIPKRIGSSSYETKAKLAYSDKGIYGVYSCSDKTITSTLRKDFSDLWNEDVVEIFFWPEESTRLYFEYELSPNNYELPILVPNFKGEQFGWLPWHYEGDRKTVHQTKILRDAAGNVSGWTAEFFIPFELLKPLRNVPGKAGMRWRVNLYRIDYDDNGHTYWTWQPVQDNFHDIDRYGTLIFE